MDPKILEVTRLWTLATPAVSAFITSLVPHFQDRDDILQETAVAVMESYGRFDPTQSFTGWAIGIARNQVRLHCRRQSRLRVAFDNEAVDALALVFASDSSANQHLDYLGDCMKLLEARARELCRLRYEHDLKPAAIGARVGMGANAVAKALQRIRDSLRDCIERKAAGVGA